jgi:menaquinone-specific isochorismate synthase
MGRSSKKDPVKVEVGSSDHFKQSVSLALDDIADGNFQKIVLARAVDVTTASDLHPLAALNRLRERYPDCYSFSAGNGRGQSFIGATPERLVKVVGRSIETEALAGSTRRGGSAMEDAMLVRQLLNSDKDVREQRLVLESIVRRLESLGVMAHGSGRIGVLQLSNVQHLHTPLEADLPDGVDLLRLVEELHPTPAVGGTPRTEACRRIRELEPFQRGLYAAPLGWIDADGDGEFVVGIRSALIDGSKARVFAGAGIVDGSDAQREYAETELKLSALLDNLFG